MAFIHKFQLVIAVGLVSILIIGISSVDCDKVEDRSRKDYQSPYYPVQDNISSIKKILDYIKSKFTDNTQGNFNIGWQAYVFFIKMVKNLGKQRD